MTTGRINQVAAFCWDNRVSPSFDGKAGRPAFKVSEDTRSFQRALYSGSLSSQACAGRKHTVHLLSFPQCTVPYLEGSCRSSRLCPSLPNPEACRQEASRGRHNQGLSAVACKAVYSATFQQYPWGIDTSSSARLTARASRSIAARHVEHWCRTMSSNRQSRSPPTRGP
jgi:hypothetical protein